MAFLLLQNGGGRLLLQSGYTDALLLQDIGDIEYGMTVVERVGFICTVERAGFTCLVTRDGLAVTVERKT